MEGILLLEEEMTQGVFPRKMKMRPVQVDYSLKGRWDVVSLDSPTSWATVREQVLAEFYQRFGLIKLGDGTKTIRWNEQTWRAVRDMMAFEYDPRYGAAGPSNG